jgi:hypothetical protein
LVHFLDELSQASYFLVMMENLIVDKEFVILDPSLGDNALVVLQQLKVVVFS